MNIEHLNIAFRSEPCDAQLHGTTITLTHLHQGMAFPDANKLRQVLLQDYGRQDDFRLDSRWQAPRRGRRIRQLLPRSSRSFRR